MSSSSQSCRLVCDSKLDLWSEWSQSGGSLLLELLSELVGLAREPPRPTVRISLLWSGYGIMPVVMDCRGALEACLVPLNRSHSIVRLRLAFVYRSSADVTLMNKGSSHLSRYYAYSAFSRPLQATVRRSHLLAKALSFLEQFGNRLLLGFSLRCWRHDNI